MAAFQCPALPALAGIELLKDGGYLGIRLDQETERPAEIMFHPLSRLR